MLKKLFGFAFIASTLILFVPIVEGANNHPENGSSIESKDSRKIQERFNIMREDENEDTDTLAIPLDDSAVEDEEEVDYIEGKPFNLDIPDHEGNSQRKF